MAKVALSITIDKSIAEKLRLLAKEENRTVSNFSEVIFSRAIEERMSNNHAGQSLAKAKLFAKDFKAANYGETVNVLEKNVSLSPDKDLLDF